MANSYNWNITGMYTVPQLDGETDVVVNATWVCTGDQLQTIAAVNGNTQFTLNPDQKNFIPYAQLTEAQVMQWVFDSLGENGIASTESDVQSQINSILNPPVEPSKQPLPWSA